MNSDHHLPRLEHYELVTDGEGKPIVLGRGSMGITYRAVDVNLRCSVALKVIRERYLDDESARLRFLREARVAARLRHPNVASVLHLGRTGNSYFYAMEFVEGETLESLIARSGRLEARLALEIATRVAAGLAAVHKHKIVHRDIKPANVMVGWEEDNVGMVKIIDLGLAKTVEKSKSEKAITIPGSFAGTPEFASPEQSAGLSVDLRSDLYSLGATLWAMLAGKPPFRGTPAEVRHQHQQAALRLEEMNDVPQPLVALLEVLLQKDPLRRFQTSTELLRVMPTIKGALEEGRPVTLQNLLKIPPAGLPGVRVKLPVQPWPDRISLARLPVTGKEVFGREEDLAFLDAAWANPQVNMASVVAWAGVGKSTLVNHWLRGLAADRYRSADLVFGWSFYRQGTSGGSSSADEFLDAALVWFGDPDPRCGTALGEGRKIGEADGRSAHVIGSGRLEPLQNPPGPQEGRVRDSSLQALLRELAAFNVGLCVITTRLAVADLAQHEGSSALRRGALAPPLPENITEMEPLFLAVVYGCQAGLLRDTLHQVYPPRIQRGNASFAANVLGVRGALLSALASFFEHGHWGTFTQTQVAGQHLTAEDQLIVLTQAGVYLTATRGFAAPELRNCYKRVESLCHSLERPPLLYAALMSQWRYSLATDNQTASMGIAKRIYALADGLHNPALMVGAHRALATTLFYKGDFESGLEHARLGLEIWRTGGLPSLVEEVHAPAILCLSFGAVCEWMLGEARSSQAMMMEALALGETLNDTHALAMTLILSGVLKHFENDPAKVERCASDLIELSTRHHFTSWLAAGEILHGWVRSFSGHAAPGLVRIEEGINDWRATGSTFCVPFWLALKAEALYLAHRAKEALEAIREAEELVERFGERCYFAELLRLHGLFLAALGAAETEIEATFNKAIRIANEQKARALTKRAETSQAEYCRQRQSVSGGNGFRLPLW